MKQSDFSGFNFQLIYLAFLTKEKIKPLSRWEGKIRNREIQFLKSLGLIVEFIPRKLLSGKVIHETIFSTSSGYINFYRKQFSNTIVSRSQSVIKREGFLFGYPSCCVNNFAKHGYTSNQLIKKDQEILFHWACPDCRITPSLLPYYQQIYQYCEQLTANRGKPELKLMKKAIPAAAAILLGFSAANLQANDHWLPLAGDNDNDFLTQKEEMLLGTDHFYFEYSAADSIARKYKTIIDSLPREMSATECYAIDSYAYGIHVCPICGEEINMGFVTIHNPLRQLQIDIPFMALHFMENGNFSYIIEEDTTIIEEDTTRIDIELMKKILAPFDVEHLIIQTENDSDDDGLNNTVEEQLKTDPQNPQTHDLGIDDGQEISEQIVVKLSGLPVVEYGETPPADQCYLIYQELDGLETCDVCGGNVNMGFVEVHNPELEILVQFPIIGLHYMAHGRFAYSGSENQGEIDPLILASVLEMELTDISDLEVVAEKFDYQLINYPNPFNPETTIYFTAKNAKNAKVEIYNIKGQKVKTFPFSALCHPASVTLSGVEGQYSVTWNGRDDTGKAVASGVYFMRLKVDGEARASKKMLLLK